jgi:hypothetical protein
MEAREVRPSRGMGVSLRDAQRAHRRSSARRTGYSWECLSRLARILVRCGHSPNDLVSELREICRTLRVPRRRWDPTQLNFISDLPHVIARWHSDPRYKRADFQGRVGWFWIAPTARNSDNEPRTAYVHATRRARES